MFGRPEHHLSGEICFLKKRIKNLNINIIRELEVLIYTRQWPFSSRFVFGRQSVFPKKLRPLWKHADADIFGPECPLKPINPPATDDRNRSSPGRLPFSPGVAKPRRTLSRALLAWSHAHPAQSICVDSALR